MKIRTQLVLTFLLLAILPLGFIVAFNYVSSSRAVRRAVEVESAELTREMEGRMALVRGELARRVNRVGALPFGEFALISEEEERKRELMGRAMTELGDAAPFVESFRFVPSKPPERPPLLDRSPIAPDVPIPAAPPELHISGGGAELELPEILAELEGELDELPPEERARVLEKARKGVEAAAVVTDALAAMFGKGDLEDMEVPDPGEEPGFIDFLQKSVAFSEEELARFSERSQEWAEAEENHLDELEYMSEFKVPVRERGRLVGEVKAELSVGQILAGVLGMTRRGQGEVPFALDPEGRLFTANEEDRDHLAGLPVGGGDATAGVQLSDDWVVVKTEDAESGLTFGIARPISESLAELRRNSARNFVFGVGLLGMALLVILPISGRMSRSVQLLTRGAEKIAAGDLEVRVPVQTRSEIGQLAQAFNQMAGDLRTKEVRLVEETQRRHDQEVQQRLLQAEYDRKSDELEDARLFQLSLLPKEIPRLPGCEVAVYMKTATEVGGDYYDFKVIGEDVLITAVGDATGHGARAGTMVTVIKSLFSAAPANSSLSGFLEEAATVIRRMELGRMAMALAVARLEGRRLTISSAGMPPPLLARRDAGVEEIDLAGMPLGGIASSYQEIALDVAPGDTLLLMSDGFPELPNPAGDPLGYDAVRRLFEKSADRTPQEIIGNLSAAASDWSEMDTPNDDVTFVVIRVLDGVENLRA